MIHRQDPRDLMASALRELSLHKSIERITIKEITETAGYSRKSFYYYFQDKYDLIAWYFNYDGQRLLWDNITKTWLEILTLYLEDIRTYRQFYLAIYTDKGPVPLIEHYFDYIVETMSLYMKDRNHALGEDELFAMRYVAYANTCMAKYWLLDGCTVPAHQLAEKLVASYPSILKEVFF